MTTPDDLKKAANLLEQSLMSKVSQHLRLLQGYQEGMIHRTSSGSRKDYMLTPEFGSLQRVAFDWLVSERLLLKNKRKGKEHTWVYKDSRWANHDDS